VLKYRLYTEDGEDMGDFETVEPTWHIGDQLFNRDRVRFEVVEVVSEDDFDSDVYHGLLIVTPIEVGEPG
jgi:hypothetical protein